MFYPNIAKYYCCENAGGSRNKCKVELNVLCNLCGQQSLCCTCGSMPTANTGHTSKKLLGKVLICQRTEHVIILVIAVTGIECASQSCSVFGIWGAECSWVCMYCIIIKDTWLLSYVYYMKSIMVFLPSQKSRYRQQKTDMFHFCSLSQRLFLISLHTHTLLVLAVLSSGIFSFRT